MTTGADAPRLEPRRLAGALGGLALLDVLVPHGPDVGTPLQVLVLAVASMPLATAAVRELLPLRRLGGRLLAGAVVAIAATAVLIVAGFPGTPATIAKLISATFIGYALASLLQTTAEVVVIALLIAAVDVYSVAAGPTKVIVEQHEDVLNAFTLAFHPLGSQGVAQIGASDFIFFALFLAATERLGLRMPFTWTAMTLSFGATMALSYLLDAALPALPLLSLAFLLANADLLATHGRVNGTSPKRE
jgi:hypothetical protein